jgi:hypothetical protein
MAFFNGFNVLGYKREDWSGHQCHEWCEQVTSNFLYLFFMDSKLVIEFISHTSLFIGLQRIHMWKLTWCIFYIELRPLVPSPWRASRNFSTMTNIKSASPTQAMARLGIPWHWRCLWRFFLGSSHNSFHHFFSNYVHILMVLNHWFHQQQDFTEPSHDAARKYYNKTPKDERSQA